MANETVKYTISIHVMRTRTHSLWVFSVAFVFRNKIYDDDDDFSKCIYSI